MTYDGLTATDVEKQRFAVVRGNKEGYEMEEVDIYLDEVERSLALREQEVERLGGELSRAEIRSTDATHRLANAEAELERAREEVQRVRDEAEIQLNEARQLKETAGVERIEVRTVPEASAAAAKLLEHATATADTMLTESNAESERLMANALSESDRLKEEAHNEANRVRSELEAEAEAMRKTLEDERNTTLSNLENEKLQLEAEVKALQEFEEAFRVDLSSYLTQLHERVNDRLNSTPEEESPEEVQAIIDEESQELAEEADAEARMTNEGGV